MTLENLNVASTLPAAIGLLLLCGTVTNTFIAARLLLSSDLDALVWSDVQSDLEVGLGYDLEPDDESSTPHAALENPQDEVVDVVPQVTEA